ncbi:MAG: penicillin-binding transpeptidase domain-containing protein, partial [Cohnella sp.]|nr:penicillin-binding transpeptidase domain-containing protein [Cohnella sp.]
VQAYLADWQQRDFAGMYALLTPAAQSAITEQQFVERYRKIYDGIEADNVAVSAQIGSSAGSQEKSPTTSVLGFDYSVRMDSVAGPIAFEQHGRLRKSEDGGETKWLIDWKPSLIFPGMEEGDVVRVQHSGGERGEIVDRAGDGLAVNGTVPQLGIVPGKLGDDPEEAKASIAEKLGISVKDIDRKLGASWVKPDLYVPIAIVAEGTEDKFAGIPGVVIQNKKLRVYPLGEAAAHLTGYVGEINADELAKKKDKGYEAGDYIGKAGLEQLLEEELRGTDGIAVVLTDGKGFVKTVLAEKQAVKGKTFQLAIDAALQKTIYNELKAEASSMSAIDPKSGDILALLSTPSYDPNAFVRGISKTQYNAWNDDPRHPFLNRFSKAFVPGSTFKLVTAAIGLDTNTLDPNERKSISGMKWAKDKSWGNYYVTRVHEAGSVDLAKALLYSDNIYFAQTALQIGKTKLADGAAKFGIGEKLPIEYPINASQLANGAIKNEIQLADSGYGQGQVTLSTLHAALIFSTLANDGHIVYPKLVLTDESKSPQVWKERAMSPETAELLKDNLVKAVASPEGVGHGTYIEGAMIAGKTGTAELKASKGVEGLEYG